MTVLARLQRTTAQCGVIGGALAVAFLLAPHCVAAQDAAAPTPWYTRVQLDGFAAASWSYNFNRPDSRTNTLRVFDFDDNSMKVDVLELVMQKAAVDRGSSGFRFDLVFGGSVPRVSAAAGLFRDANGVAEDFDLQQAFGRWVAPVGHGLRLDAGKFVTPFGYEVIEGYDGFNDNATRSLLFGYAIPFTHTGVRAGYDFGGRVTGTLLVVNGWDLATDNNSAKTVGGQLTVTPSDRFTCSGTFMEGAERARESHDLRHTYGVTTTCRVATCFVLGAEGVYGREVNGVVSGDAVWGGAAGYARLEVGGRASVAVRGEWFKDRDGFRTGTAQTLTEGTLTPEVRLTDQMRLRADVRLDHSDKLVFEDLRSRDTNQLTVLLSGLCIF